MQGEASSTFQIEYFYEFMIIYWLCSSGFVGVRHYGWHHSPP
jgi:hypothetical protein